MDVDEITIVLMDLKYCDRCGALFLRPQESEVLFCPSCEVEMVELPLPSSKVSRAYRPRARKIGAECEGEALLAYSEGGNA